MKQKLCHLKTTAIGSIVVSLLLSISTPIASCQTFYGAGVNLLPQSSPKPTGYALASITFSETEQLYSFTKINWTLVRTNTGLYTVQTSPVTGFASKLRDYGKVSLYMLAAGGAATSGTTSSGAFLGGGFATIPTKWPNVFITVGGEILKTSLATQTLVSIGFIGRKDK